MPRLYREAPLYSIWEGSGNVICLDVLRTLAKEPGSLDALMHEIHLGTQGDARLARSASEFASKIRKQARPGGEISGAGLQRDARRLTETAALLLQASLLARHGTAAIAEAFIASRLGRDGGFALGTLPETVDIRGILNRAGA